MNTTFLNKPEQKIIKGLVSDKSICQGPGEEEWHFKATVSAAAPQNAQIEKSLFTAPLNSTISFGITIAAV